MKGNCQVLNRKTLWSLCLGNAPVIPYWLHAYPGTGWKHYLSLLLSQHISLKRWRNKMHWMLYGSQLFSSMEHVLFPQTLFPSSHWEKGLWVQSMIIQGLDWLKGNSSNQTRWPFQRQTAKTERQREGRKGDKERCWEIFWHHMGRKDYTKLSQVNCE